MAEAVILPVTNSILKAVAAITVKHVMGHIGDEIKAFKSFKKDIKAITEDLESITSVIQDAEARQYSNTAMKIWLRDLKNVVYDIDDLLDEVATNAAQRKTDKAQLLPQFRYYISFKPLISRFDLSRKIKHLRLQLDRIVVRKSKFGLTDHPIGAPSVERDVFDVCGYVNHDSIVGRDEAKNDILNIVLGAGDRCSVYKLPILGMGGIGKTALAKLVYRDVDQFDIKLWVCVSDKFDIQKILQDILKDATLENTTDYSLGKLVETVRNLLASKKFFLVLDDLWEEDIVLWRRLESILDVGRRGSVILITTRKEIVASITQTVEPYNLRMLSDSDCRCIFNRLAFAEGEEEKYPRLLEIGMRIVEKCCGIPLVVQSLGSLLRSEKDEGEWQRINDMANLNQLDGQYNSVKQLLRLSYDKLPSHMKPSFAHLSLFPKDCVYAPYYYFYWCSALGCVPLRDGSYVKDNFFFNELLTRSMVQDVKWDFRNKVLTFKMHDLLHDLAEDVLGEELCVLNMNMLSAPDSSRYIAWGVREMPDESCAKQVKARKARAFLFHYEMRNVSRCFLKAIISNMPRLRILGLSSHFEELPSTIRNLIHLRVLDLSNNDLIKSLPSTVCELLNLECLLLDGCKQLEKLPTKIYKLVKLRFLSVSTCQRSFVGTKLNKLPCLQHLWLVSCKGLVSLWDDEQVGSLTSLCSLRIFDCPKLISLPNSMKLLASLDSLRIVNCQELDLERGDGLKGLQSLVSLAIIGLPQLSFLSDGVRSAASSLTYLWIEDCEQLAELPKWLQSFDCLQKLGIVNCHNLLSLPQEIRQLSSLQYVKISNCPHLSRRCATSAGEDASLIQHVSEIWLDGLRLIPSQQ